MAKRFVTARLRAPRLIRAPSGHNPSMSTGSIAAKGRRAGKSPWVERLGRAGLVAKGALYALVGILAFKVALGGREESPDKTGALRTIAEQPFGKVLLVLLAAGLAGYALWRIAQAIFDRDDEGEGPTGLAKRATALGKAAWYAILFVLTASVLVGGSTGDGNQQEATAGVFDLPLGRYLVYAAGLAFLGAGGFNGYRAVTCKFKDKLKTGEMDEKEEQAATAIGVLGYLARCVVFALIGVFLVKAAWEYDPNEARSLDGALLELTQQPYGGLLLGAVAVGLLAYAFYCFVQARYRRI